MTGAAMRGCEDFRALISAELDREVALDESREVAQHLARCGACARARADYVSAAAALIGPLSSERAITGRDAKLAPGAAGTAAPPEVWDAIERHLNAPLRQAPAPERSRLARAVRAAAVLAAVSAGSFALGRLSAPAPAAPEAGRAPAEVASAPSREAEEAAIAIIADAFFTGSSDGGGAAEDLNARIRSLAQPARAPAAPAREGSY